MRFKCAGSFYGGQQETRAEIQGNNTHNKHTKSIMKNRAMEKY